MKRIGFVYVIVLLFLLLLVFGLNIFVGGMITSPSELALGLASPLDSPQDWSMQDWALLKYRALFKLIVHGTWAILFAPNDAWGFYLTFVAWSFVLFSAALMVFYFYLRLLEFDPRASFVGGLLFLVSPPVLLAYRYPVYTREDPLAYFLVTLGLIAIFKSRAFLVGFISVAAALTRETTLIVPLSYILVSQESWRKRIGVFVAPILALIGIRILWGFAIGNNFESSILNFRFPFETSAFMFCVFGALWLPYLLGLRNRWQAGDHPNPAWRVLVSTGPLIFLLVIGATLFLSRAREIRIAFILFPWAIPFALDWFRSNIGYFRTLVGNYSYWLLSFLILGLVSAVILYFHLTNAELMKFILGDFKNGYWLFLGAVHLSATLAILLPMLRRRATAHSV